MTGAWEEKLWRYGLAVIAVAAGVAVRLLLDPWLGDLFPFATVFLAVVMAARYGGFGPAVAASLLGAFTSGWLLLPPRGVFTIHEFENQAGLVLFLCVSLGIAFLGGSMHTARDRAETAASAAVRQREELRQTLISIGDAVIVTDRDGRVNAMNPVAQRLTGRGEEAIGRPLADVFVIVNEQTRRPVESPAERVLRQGTVVGLANHTVLIAADGIERPIDDSAAPIRDADGRTVGVVLVFRDVTERRAAAAALRRNEERLRLFVEHAPVAVAMFDRDMCYLVASQRWRADFELGERDLAGLCQDQVLPNLPGSWKDAHRRCLSGDVERADADRFTSRDGREEWLRWEMRPWPDDRGEVGGLLIFAEIITEQKRAQQVVQRQAGTLTGILRASVNHIYVVHRDGRYQYVSDGGARVVGQEPAAMIGKTWRDLGLPAEVLTRFDATARRGARLGPPRVGRPPSSSTATRPTTSSTSSPPSTARASRPGPSSSCRGTSPSGSGPSRMSASSPTPSAPWPGWWTTRAPSRRWRRLAVPHFADCVRPSTCSTRRAGSVGSPSRTSTPPESSWRSRSLVAIRPTPRRRGASGRSSGPADRS